MLWRHNDAAGPHNGFSNKRSNGFRPLAFYQLLQIVYQSLKELGLGLARQTLAVIMRRCCVQHSWHRQIEGCMERRQTREGTACNGDPVITPLTRNDFFLFRSADCIVVVPNQFDLGIVCVATGQTKETRPASNGAICLSFSANNTEGSLVLPAKS